MQNGAEGDPEREIQVELSERGRRIATTRFDRMQVRVLAKMMSGAAGALEYSQSRPFIGSIAHFIRISDFMFGSHSAPGALGLHSWVTTTSGK